jgi:tRNA(Ile)-lysidine synthase
METHEKFIKDLNIKHNEYVVVACSGGPDSMYLLYLLWSMGLKIVCAHVNHKMRAASEDEYLFVKNYCTEHNIIFEGTEINTYSDDNFHDYARNFRYNFFESLINKYHAKYLFTAHHGDDLIETILMRLVRGTTLKGYAGFRSIVDKDTYKIVRPLITLTKSEIEEKDKYLNIPYAIDESNLGNHYTRNRYRHVVLPFLKSEEPNVHTKFLNFSNTINEVDEYFNRTIDKIIGSTYKNNILDLVVFSRQDKLIQKLLLEKIISDWYPDDLFLINNNHIDEILKLISSNKSNSFIVLPNNLIVTKEYTNLLFSKKSTTINSIDCLFDNLYESSTFILSKVNESNDTSNYTIRLNSKTIKLPLHIKTRTNGMKMKVKNMTGYKKINDIFIDMKIPKSKRDEWPILLDDNFNVLWLPGLKKSDFDVVINGDYDIIITCEKKEEK